MREERMMILSMLEEGKITSEEAVQLMEALDEIEIPVDDKDFGGKNSNFTINEDKPQKPILDTLEDIGSEISNAFSNMFNGLMDMGNSFGFRANYETISNNLELDLSDIKNPSLDLKSVNGYIKLRPTDEDKLLIKVTCQYKNGLFTPPEAYFNFTSTEGKIVFTPKYNNNISIKLDVLLPEKNYNQIVLNSTNGKIDIDDLNLHTLECITTNSSIDISDLSATKVDLTTKNGKIECKDITSNMLNLYTTNSNIFLMDISGSEIQARTANGKISINDITSDTITCKTSNGSIEAIDITCETVDLITSNGRITCNDFDLDKVKNIHLATSNGIINSDLDILDKDVYFDLETSMGNINLELPNLIYKVNKQINLGLKKIVAHSVNYNENNDDLKFIASTSNGSIKIT